MSSPAIEVRDLRKSYGARPALRGIDLRVEAGTVIGLIGPNGAGKSTTLRILLDILRPSGGSVRVLGEDPRHGGPALRRRIGYLPGDLRLDGRVTGHRLLAFYRGVSGPVDAERAHRLAERLELDLSRPVRALSKGNRQKLGILQAFLHRPELLVLDEPTSGLDPLMQRVFLQLVSEARDQGQTVLLSSHVLSEIQQVADEVTVLSEGRIVTTGDVAALRSGAARRIDAVFADADAEDVKAALARLALREVAVEAAPGGVHVSGLLDGEPDAFVKAAARLRTVHLTIEEPNLEEAVLRLYGSRGPA